MIILANCYNIAMQQLFQIDTFNPEKPYIYNGICFDPVSGSGSTGNTANINYMGCVVFIEPETFLNLSYALPTVLERGSADFFYRTLPQGDWCIGPPVLAPWPVGDPVAGQEEQWRIRGHEGRHRVLTLKRLGFDLVPVYLYPLHLRARHINAELLDKLSLLLNENENDWIFLRPEFIVIDQKVYVLAGSQQIADYKAKNWVRPTTIKTESQKTMYTVQRPGDEEREFYRYWSKPIMYRRNPDPEYCPVQTLGYGGLRSGGGFHPNTMYEAGAMQIGEAAHCMLGSWWKREQDFEPNHLLEEFLIIENIILNYGREIVDGMAFSHPWSEYLWGVGGVNPRSDETRDDSVASMRRAAIRLEEKTYQFSCQIALPHPLQQRMARAVYDFLYTFSVSLQSCLEPYPRLIRNVYMQAPVRLRLAQLRKAVEEWLREFHPGLEESLQEAGRLPKGMLRRLMNSYKLPSGNSVDLKIVNFYREQTKVS